MLWLQLKKAVWVTAKVVSLAEKSIWPPISPVSTPDTVSWNNFPSLTHHNYTFGDTASVEASPLKWPNTTIRRESWFSVASFVRGVNFYSKCTVFKNRCSKIKPFSKTEDFVRQIQKIYYELFVLKKTPAQLNEIAEYKPLVESELGYKPGSNDMWGRHWRFCQQLDSIDLADSWGKSQLSGVDPAWRRRLRTM